MAQQAERYGTPWSREDLVLAFELYCRIPFRKTKASNAEVREFAGLLRRSPAAVARKLGNFGAFDSELQKQRITGLTHTGLLDREIWDEFHASWNDLVVEANRLRSSLANRLHQEQPIARPTGPSERLGTTKQRIHQSFFRQAILSSYDETCCVTGLRVAQCLVASHIVPWSEEEALRTDPTNGLCLSATFDRLFDAGLVTISRDLCLNVARRLITRADGPTRELICTYHGKPIVRPKRFMPSPRHLDWHRVNIFVD